MSDTFAPERRIDIVDALNELASMGGGGCVYTAGDAIEIVDGVISVEFASDPDFMDYMGVTDSKSTRR